mgnify:CR=1 FL=1
MPRNTKGGKGYKKGKKGETEEFKSKKPIIYRQEGEEYAIISKMLGNCRVSCSCLDGIERLGVIRGSFVKKVWISVGDVVLVSIRDFQDNKCDIIHKYSDDDKQTLLKEGYLKKDKMIDPNTKEPYKKDDLEEEVLFVDNGEEEEEIDFDDI